MESVCLKKKLSYFGYDIYIEECKNNLKKNTERLWSFKK